MSTQKTGLLFLLAFLFCLKQAGAQALAPELKPLAPLVNQEWIGRFDDPKETQEIFEKFESILDGWAVRETRAVPAAGNFRSEKIFYWDPEAKAISYIRITANRYLLRGTVTVKDSILVYEGISYAPDGSSRKTRGEIIIKGDGTYVEKEGHTIVFKKNR